MRVDALQPIVVGDAGHNIAIGVRVHHITEELAKALGGDEPQADAARVTKLRLLSAVQVKTQVVYLLSRLPLEQYVVFGANGPEVEYEHRRFDARNASQKQHHDSRQAKDVGGADSSLVAMWIVHGAALPIRRGRPKVSRFSTGRQVLWTALVACCGPSVFSVCGPVHATDQPQPTLMILPSSPKRGADKVQQPCLKAPANRPRSERGCCGTPFLMSQAGATGIKQALVYTISWPRTGSLVAFLCTDSCGFKEDLRLAVRG